MVSLGEGKACSLRLGVRTFSTHMRDATLTASPITVM